MPGPLHSTVRIAWRAAATMLALAAPLSEASWFIYLERNPEVRFLLDEKRERAEPAPMFTFVNMLIFPPEQIEKEIELYTKRPELFPPERIDVETEDDRVWREIFSVRPEFVAERGPPLLVGHPAGGSRRSRLYEVDGLILEAGCGSTHYPFIRVLNAPVAGSKLEQAQAVADRLFPADAFVELYAGYQLADRVYGGAVNDDGRPPPNDMFNWRRTVSWASDGRIVGFYGVDAPYGNMPDQFRTFEFAALHIEPTEPVVEPE